MRSKMPNTSTMPSVLIDTSYLVGLVDSMDVWHEQSRAIASALEESAAQLVYADCVVGEAIGVLARRSEERRRPDQISSLMDRLHQHVPPSAITWIYGQVRRWYGMILQRVREGRGRLNFHDALLILAAREGGIPAIVSFDRDFDGVPELVRLHRPDAVIQWGRED